MSQSTVMSLYIPHVFGHITKDFMTKTIEFQGLGKVKNIDFVEKLNKNGKISTSAFVHFDYWYDNTCAIHFQERVKNPDKEAKIVYREPWFWACFENKGKKHIPGERKEIINLTNLNDLSNIFEEEKNNVELPQEIEDKLERQLLDEFGCNEYKHEYDLILYQKEVVSTVSDTKTQINMEYVRNLEMLNYKLIYDLYELRGDFISTF
jgi:hypothetical protein